MYGYHTLLIPIGKMSLLAFVMNTAVKGQTSGSATEIQYLAQGPGYEPA